MLELVEQIDGEGVHGSHPGTNLQGFLTHRRLLSVSDCDEVVKCNFKEYGKTAPKFAVFMPFEASKQTSGI